MFSRMESMIGGGWRGGLEDRCDILSENGDVEREREERCLLLERDGTYESGAERLFLLSIAEVGEVIA